MKLNFINMKTINCELRVQEKGESSQYRIQYKTVKRRLRRNYDESTTNDKSTTKVRRTENCHVCQVRHTFVVLLSFVVLSSYFRRNCHLTVWRSTHSQQSGHHIMGIYEQGRLIGIYDFPLLYFVVK